jgi:hypothetical protein
MELRLIPLIGSCVGISRGISPLFPWLSLQLPDNGRVALILLYPSLNGVIASEIIAVDIAIAIVVAAATLSVVKASPSPRA